MFYFTSCLPYFTLTCLYVYGSQEPFTFTFHEAQPENLSLFTKESSQNQFFLFPKFLKGQHGGTFLEYNILGFDEVYFCINSYVETHLIRAFSSSVKIPPYRWYLCIRLNGVTLEETAVFN